MRKAPQIMICYLTTEMLKFYFHQFPLVFFSRYVLPVLAKPWHKSQSKSAPPDMCCQYWRSHDTNPNRNVLPQICAASIGEAMTQSQIRMCSPRYVLTVLEAPWHPNCVRCSDCGAVLNEKCFSREGKIYCRQDFYR